MDALTKRERKLIKINLKNCINMFKEVRELVAELNKKDLKIALLESKIKNIGNLNHNSNNKRCVI